MTEPCLRRSGTGIPMPETTDQTDGSRLHPPLRHIPIGDRDRSFAVTALSLAVATITADVTEVSLSNGAAPLGGH